VQSWILSVRPATETNLPSVDVAVRARPDATVADLARSLGRHLAPDQRTLLLVPNDGGQLWPAERRLSECGLRTGDLVDVGPAPASWRDRPAGASGARAVLRVTDGPDRGARVRVAAGQATIGRAAGCTLRLSDPQVSLRHARIELGPRPVVHDEGSANGTSIAGAPAAASQVDWGTEIRVGATRIVIEPGDVVDPELPVSVWRPPRFGDPLRDDELDIPAPPSRNKPTPLPWAILALPMVMGAAMFMRMHTAYALVYMLAWPVLGLLGYWQQRRTAEKHFQEELREWRIDVDELLDELDANNLRQRERLLDDFPDEQTLRARAASRNPYLWARAEDRAQFLTTRVGTGPVPALLTGTLRDGGDRKERRQAAAEVAERAVLEELPVLADLTQHALVAVTGEDEAVDALARAVLLRIGFDHSPAEVSIAACLGRRRRHHEAWLRWLPHTSARLGGEPPVAVGSRDATALLEHLVAEGDGLGHTICLVDDDAGVPRRTVEAVAQAAAGRGVHLLWLGRSAAEVPAATGLLVDLDAGMVGVRDRMGTARLEVPDRASLEHAWRHARSVTAYVDEAAVLPPSTAIPTVVRLPEVSSDLEDLDAPDAVLRRWSQAGGLRAQIGRGVDGTVTIDLREDGPHGLVAGTTGSGKSELLQSLICSLALNNPPERITFLLVDYKGGAAFRECADLPHTVGYITDLTPALVSRALTSLGAEITKREELLGQYEVKDLIQLEREHPEAAPPSLLICVDEFAALTKEVPDFVDGMVNLAQRGRSLGMHLLLATQRPAGVVTGPIRANTDLRIALRVASADDSRDVLDSPEAARISRRTPGRAWVRRTGHGTAELVQSAWTGARAPLVDVEDAVVVQPFAATTTSEPDQHGGSDVRLDPRTDLERCVRSIQEAFVLSEQAAPHRPWLPSLPSELLLNAEDVARGGAERGTGRVRLGLLDDPAAQAQPDWVVDLASIGHLLVHGASGAGKTELLRTAALSASVGDAAGEEGVAPYVYGIDYAGGGLTAIAGLPTVAAIVSETQVGRVLRLLRLLQRTTAERAQALAARGCSDVDDLGRHGIRLPRVYVLVDNLPALVEELEGGGPLYRDHMEHLQQVLQNGRRVGVHVVATAPGRVGVPTALGASFGARVVLRMPTTDDYLMLGVPSKVLDLETPAGAGLVGRRLIQVATTGGVGTPVQAERIRAFGDRVAPAVEGRGTAPVPPMPTRVTPEQLPTPEGTLVPLGVDADAVAPIAPDLLAGPVLVAGRSRSGRTSALDGIEALAARAAGSARSPYVVRSADPQEAAARLEQWLNTEPEGSGSWALLLVDGAEAWDTRGVADLGVSGAVASLVKACTEQAHRVALVATVDVAAARQRGGPEGLVSCARRSRRGFLLAPEWNEGDVFGVTVPTRTIEPMTGTGRGLWCENGQLRVAQLVGAPEPAAVDELAAR
jgi:DNA segregation ATPase FtsK/SpoIIIE, S-DNA-T family